MSTPHTLIEVVKLSSDYLGGHGSESPRLDAELLAAQALGIRRLDLYLQFDRPLDDNELTGIRELVRRRGGGEPVAYITGRREFYGREFRVTSAVLIPRPDTETLVETVLTWARAHDSQRRVLDVGTGSGCIALTLAAELPESAVVATDSSAEALEVARVNADVLGVGDRIDFREGSWAQPVKDGEVFDIIVSNPPYILAAEMPDLSREVREHEPHAALTDSGDGLASYREIFEIAESFSASDGLVAVEIDYRRAAAVSDMARLCFGGAAVNVVKDLAGHDRVVTVVRA